MLDVKSKEVDLSLNSLVGLDSPKTMKMKGLIENKCVVVLIHSGASHNFIVENLVKELNLPRSPSWSYGIMLETGDLIQVMSICKGVVHTLSNLTIINDFLPSFVFG